MDFERARTQEQFLSRRKDIMNACMAIFESDGYEAINFKRLSQMTTIQRSTIYNYYSTKDEILIDVLAEEMRDWTADLQKMLQASVTYSIPDFSERLTNALASRERLLRLYSMLFDLLEPNCSFDRLVEFKKSAITTAAMLCQVISRHFPDFQMDKVVNIANSITCLVLGLYPMSHLNEKQIKAIEAVGTSYCTPDFETICKTGIIALLSS